MKKPALFQEFERTKLSIISGDISVTRSASVFRVNLRTNHEIPLLQRIYWSKQNVITG